jgi:hypothetical protein
VIYLLSVFVLLLGAFNVLPPTDVRFRSERLTWTQQSGASEAVVLAWPRLYPATCVERRCSAYVHSVPRGERVFIIERWQDGRSRRYHVAGETLYLPLLR